MGSEGGFYLSDTLTINSLVSGEGSLYHSSVQLCEKCVTVGLGDRKLWLGAMHNGQHYHKSKYILAYLFIFLTLSLLKFKISRFHIFYHTSKRPFIGISLFAIPDSIHVKIM